MRSIEQTDKSLQGTLWFFFWIQVSFSIFLVTATVTACLANPAALNQGFWAFLAPVPLLLWLARMAAATAREIATPPR
jgi:hypothetical protein